MKFSLFLGAISLATGACAAVAGISSDAAEAASLEAQVRGRCQKKGTCIGFGGSKLCNDRASNLSQAHLIHMLMPLSSASNAPGLRGNTSPATAAALACSEFLRYANLLLKAWLTRVSGGAAATTRDVAVFKWTKCT